MDNYFNIASLLSLSAEKSPDQLAVVSPRRPDVLGRSRLTLSELEKSSSALASSFLKAGFRPDNRIIVMVKPGVDFVQIIFAMFKAGLVPIMVDPGMGLKRLLACLAESRPQGMIAVSLAHLLTLTLPQHFRSLKNRVTLGARWGWGGKTLKELMEAPGDENFNMIENDGGQTAAILFTSGSTGPAKGVIYTHNMFKAQVEIIKNGLGFEPGGVDLATFPLFGLFAPALGLTSVVPNINFTKPGKVDPRRIIEPIRQFRVSSMFASPVLLGRVAKQAHDKQLKFPSIKRIIAAGAPVPPKTIELMGDLLAPDAAILTPYGATEGMPLTFIEANEILTETKVMTEQGLGICVGQPLPGISLDVIKISGRVIKTFKPEFILPQGEIGEIIARGPVVSASYFERPAETDMAIIYEENGSGFWRRMGDVGWKDAKGRLWFCGRKNHRVVTSHGTLFSIPCEAIFNNHPLVRRAALVGVGPEGQKRPVIIIEPALRLTGAKWPDLSAELLALAKTNPRTIHINTFLKYRSFPVDPRHNAKINREKLSAWAARILDR